MGRGTDVEIGTEEDLVMDFFSADDIPDTMGRGFLFEALRFWNQCLIHASSLQPPCARS